MARRVAAWTASCYWALSVAAPMNSSSDASPLFLQRSDKKRHKETRETFLFNETVKASELTKLDYEGTPSPLVGGFGKCTPCIPYCPWRQCCDPLPGALCGCNPLFCVVGNPCQCTKPSPTPKPPAPAPPQPVPVPPNPKPKPKPKPQPESRRRAPPPAPPPPEDQCRERNAACETASAPRRPRSANSSAPRVASAAKVRCLLCCSRKDGFGELCDAPFHWVLDQVQALQSGLPIDQYGAPPPVPDRVPVEGTCQRRGQSRNPTKAPKEWALGDCTFTVNGVDVDFKISGGACIGWASRLPWRASTARVRASLQLCTENVPLVYLPNAKDFSVIG